MYYADEYQSLKMCTAIPEITASQTLWFTGSGFVAQRFCIKKSGPMVEGGKSLGLQ